jgi:hypothetical protein
MQSCYLEQIKAAIVRQDPVSLNHRIAAWLSSYFDILFATNGQFHPGEKRLLTYAGELDNLLETRLISSNCCLSSGWMARSRRIEQIWNGSMKMTVWPSGLNLRPFRKAISLEQGSFPGTRRNE